MINMAKTDRTIDTNGIKYILTLQYQIQYSLFNKWNRELGNSVDSMTQSEVLELREAIMSYRMKVWWRRVSQRLYRRVVSSRSYLIYWWSLTIELRPRSGTDLRHLDRYFYGMRPRMYRIWGLFGVFWFYHKSYLTLSYRSRRTFYFFLLNYAAVNCLCLSFISYFLSLQRVLGTATSP